MTTSRPPDTTAWHALPADAALQGLGTSVAGLPHAEAARRRAQYGFNSLPGAPATSAWQRLGRQFHNPLIHVLMIAGAVTFALADYLNAGVIFGVVLINAAIGFLQEGKAERALEAVRSLLATRATVVRDGERHEIDAAQVPGDIVLLELRLAQRTAISLRPANAGND